MKLSLRINPTVPKQHVDSVFQNPTVSTWTKLLDVGVYYFYQLRLPQAHGIFQT